MNTSRQNAINLMFDLAPFYQEAGLGLMSFLRQRKIPVSVILKEAVRLVCINLSTVLSQEQVYTILQDNTHIKSTNWAITNTQQHFIPCLQNEKEAHDVYSTIVYYMYLLVANNARFVLSDFLHNQSRDYVVSVYNEHQTLSFFTATFHFTWIVDWIG